MTSPSGMEYDGSLHAARTIQLPPEILDEAAALAATMSASQAHAVAHCLYEHFGTRRLGLEALVAPSVDRRTLGTIAHAVLNEVGRAGFDLDLLDDAIERWWNRTIPGELRDDAEIDFEREMLEARLRDLVEAERASLDAVLARATYFELAFGEMDGEGRDAASRAEGLAIALPSDAPRAGSTLRGSIDRVDIVERDGRRYGVAIDYKLGRGKSNFDEMNELADFQLPIYCEVLRLFDIEPVGALYLGIGSGERYGIIRDDFASAFIPDDAKFAKNVKKLGADAFTAFMRERGDALGAQIARVARGELQIEPRKDDCKYCDLRPVCRIGTFGVGGRHDDE